MDVTVTTGCDFPCFGSIDLGALALGLVTAGLAFFVMYRDRWEREAPKLTIGHEVTMIGYGNRIVLLIPLLISNGSAARCTVDAFVIEIDEISGSAEWIGFQRWDTRPTDGETVAVRESPPIARVIPAGESQVLTLEVQCNPRAAANASSQVHIRVRANSIVNASRPRATRKYPLDVSKDFSGPPNVISAIWLGQSARLELRAPFALEPTP